MCLTGVDYFSTLGYQPGIAFIAAGALAPIATLILVILTLVGALPVYSRVAAVSPNGQGSISMLEDLLPRWRGKAFVLVLLGFAATDFIITITLSAADATEHIIHNPFVPAAFDHPVAVTLLLLTGLGAIFLKGFREAIGLAVVIVAVYLSLNVVVLAVGIREVLLHPEYLPRWVNALYTLHGSPMTMLLVALLLFPKLALGLSGFETGVAVMPLVEGEPGDTPESPVGRIHNTRKLLRTAALIMSVMLIGSSLVTTLLIPPEAFAEGGEASGRALAYLAHHYFGDVFGTIYDVSTIAILWFAGASAMAGLLNLVPRYLPRYGMAPEWTRATRPLVTLFTGIAFFITIIFNADVTAQGGAYATGVLVLMTSAALAVTLGLARRQDRKWMTFAAITLIFIYTTITNVIERPDGVQIATWFIVTIIVTSLISRVLRSTELRVQGVKADPLAAAVPPRGRERAHSHHREPARHRPARRVRAQAARRAGVAPPAAGRARAVRRGEAVGCVSVQRGAGRRRGHCGRTPRTAVCEPCHSECHRGAAAVHPRPDAEHPARVFRMDRRKSDCLSFEVPGVRRRRHRPRHAGGAQAGGAGSGAAPAGFTWARRIGRLTIVDWENVAGLTIGGLKEYAARLND